MLGEDGAEEFRGRDRVLLCEDVGGLLLGIRGDDNGVVGFGVAITQ